MIRLQPEWVGELVSMWAARDWADTHGDLGYPTVSPMFAKALGHTTEWEDPTGYSSSELRAMAAAVDWLKANHPEHWRALSREFRQWTRRTLEGKEGDNQLVLDAGALLAGYIDKMLG